MRFLQRGFRHLSGELLGAEIAEHQVRVGPSGDEAQAAFDQPDRQRLRVVEDPLLVFLEFRPERLPERHRLGGDDVLERSALDAWEHVGIDRFRVLLLAEDEPAARAAQRLVGSGRHRVGERHRRRVQPDRDHSGDVRDVADHHRARLLGDLPKLVKLERARIRGSAAEDCARPDLARLLPRRVVVDPLGLRLEAVVVDLEELPGEVHGGAVGQVPALRERERHDAVAGT